MQTISEPRADESELRLQTSLASPDNAVTTNILDNCDEDPFGVFFDEHSDLHVAGISQQDNIHIDAFESLDDPIGTNHQHSARSLFGTSSYNRCNTRKALREATQASPPPPKAIRDLWSSAQTKWFTPSLTGSEGSGRAREEGDDARSWEGCSRRNSRKSSTKSQGDILARPGQNVIHIAALSGSEGLVRLFLRRGIAPDLLDAQGYTALHYAVQRGYEAVVLTLLKGGADIEIRDVFGRTALHTAVEENQSEMAILLVHNGANMQATVSQCKR
jgi:hypothetical protein